MFEGKLEGIYLIPEKRGEPRGVEQIEAVAGKGLVGDRYHDQNGTFSKPMGPDREVTLIESEALAALERECQITLPPGQARRNLVTRGVPLNHLVGQEFAVGTVLLRGIRLCEPCKHLEGMTKEGVLKGLIHRGGLRAAIVRGGVLRQGDQVRPNS